MRSKIGENSGSSRGPPVTLVKVWIPLAPSLPMARSISPGEAAAFVTRTDPTKGGDSAGGGRERGWEEGGGVGLGFFTGVGWLLFSRRAVCAGGGVFSRHIGQARL